MKAQRLKEHKGRKSKDFKTQFQTINKQNKTGNKMKKLIALALVVLFGANFAYAQVEADQEITASATINVTPIALTEATNLNFGTFTILGGAASSGDFATAKVIQSAQNAGAATAEDITIEVDVTGGFGSIKVTGMNYAQFGVTIAGVDASGEMTLENEEEETITLTLKGYTTALGAGEVAAKGAFDIDDESVDLELGSDGAAGVILQFGGELTDLFDTNNVPKTGTFTGTFTVEVAYI